LQNNNKKLLWAKDYSLSAEEDCEKIIEKKVKLMFSEYFLYFTFNFESAV